ncbi:lysosomal acid phosphatase isoform X3 [Phascolarctos cinereus]
MAGGRSGSRRCCCWGAPLPLLVGRSLGLGLGLLLLPAVPPAQGRSLRFVILLYRHGDRSPVKAYPKDPYQEGEWPQGFGQLTKEGMLQHWELGQALRQRYQGFLNASYHREELLKFPLGPCPRFEQLQNETRQSPEYQNETAQNAKFLEMVANETGVTDLTLETAWNIYDTLFCEQTHGLPLPSWASPQTMRHLQQLKDLSFRFLFGMYQPTEKARLQGGVLLAEIRKNLTWAASASQHPKLLVYSAHDTTLVALQMALDIYNGEQAPYASCHMFELYQEDNGNFSVEMYFRNDSTKAPWPLALLRCSQSCPLADFLRLTLPLVPENWEQECQVTSSLADTEVIVALAVCGSILFLLILLLLTVLFRMQAQPPGYRHIADGEDHA